MSDIATVWVADYSTGDWQLLDGVLTQGSGLQTAVLISLFTDRQSAADDAIPDGSTDRRGWIGDLNAEYMIGSRLWLLDRSKHTADVLDKAQAYIAEGLQWLIDDGVVAGFEIGVQWATSSTLVCVIIAHKPDGNQETINFSWAWGSV